MLATAWPSCIVYTTDLRPTSSDDPRSTAEGDRSEAESAERGKQSEISERPPRLLVRLVILVTLVPLLTYLFAGADCGVPRRENSSFLRH